MALTWEPKEAAEDQFYDIDWTVRLAGDAIASHTLVAVAGSATVASDNASMTVITALLQGGLAGESCVFLCTVETAAGETLEETIILPIAAQEDTYAVQVESLYQTVEDIDRYQATSFGDASDAWLAASRFTKQRAAVSASRTIDRQVWSGAKADPTQAGAFPRSGLFYQGGVPVPSDVPPPQLLAAVSEIAAALVGGSNLQDTPNTFSYQKRLKAGSVEIEYFRQTDDNQPRFPQTIQELIGQWLGSAGSSIPVGARSAGTDGRTIFDEQYNVNRGF